MDTVSREQRSLNMSRIHSRDTKPEIFLRSALHKAGFRFRKNDRRYLGTPDIFLPRYNAVLFIHGCFWHGHRGCKLFRLPKTNISYWEEKISGNIERDRKIAAAYLDRCYRVAVVWECSITGKNRSKKLSETIEKISLWLEEDLSENYREF
ncbi:very short patch repair endonuclease [Treponema sp.]|uniref:very short patch repair endonuclease n=1 Tax=Treponema sp. TaxID=166 RepID=UPI003F058027